MVQSVWTRGSATRAFRRLAAYRVSKRLPEVLDVLGGVDAEPLLGHPHGPREPFSQVSRGQEPRVGTSQTDAGLAHVSG